MKLVVDENVSYSVVNQLRQQGWQVMTLTEEKGGSIDDQDIYQLALRENALLITRDYHFTNPLRFPAKPTKGIIYLRHGNLTSTEETEIIMKFLSQTILDEVSGKLVTLYRDTVTIR